MNDARASLHYLADRVIGRPLLLHPTKAELILHVLQGRLPIDGQALAPLGPEANRFVGERRGFVGRTPTYSFIDGAGVVSITGSLVNRGAWIGASSGLTSYEGIAAQLERAAADPQVKTVVLDIDSPGGEATGMFSLAAKVRAVAAEKPVIAVVNDMAASAAYGIASQASEIVVSETSLVGSIGVVLHFGRFGGKRLHQVHPVGRPNVRHQCRRRPAASCKSRVDAGLHGEAPGRPDRSCRGGGGRHDHRGRGCAAVIRAAAARAADAEEARAAVAASALDLVAEVIEGELTALAASLRARSASPHAVETVDRIEGRCARQIARTRARIAGKGGAHVPA
jgi:hypothetical protein